MAGQEKEAFMVCPHCQEEGFVPVRPGFNLIPCPFCEYFFVVYVDEHGRSWTREVGVLEPGQESG